MRHSTCIQPSIITFFVVLYLSTLLPIHCQRRRVQANSERGHINNDNDISNQSGRSVQESEEEPSPQMIQFMQWVTRFESGKDNTSPNLVPTSTPVQVSPPDSSLSPTTSQWAQFSQWVERFRTSKNNRTVAPVAKPIAKRPIVRPTVKPPVVTPTVRRPTAIIRPTSSPAKPPMTRAPMKVNQPPTKKPIPAPTTDYYCGCKSCTDAVYDRNADGFTCGDRIEWVIINDPEANGSEQAACRIVSEQFPNNVCGPQCNPDLCNGGKAPATSPVSFNPDYDLYCYPNGSNRKRYTNVWGKYIAEVKESPDGVCDPSSNRFSSDVVSISNDGKELKLQFKYINGTWHAGEVRVTLPSSGKPFTYGSYSFSIKSVSVTNRKQPKVVKSKALPPSLVLGFFTWDPSDDYTVRENFNREVDIELSRWKETGSNVADGMFLVQPNGRHKYRFFTGPNKTWSPGGHVYSFDWNPGKIVWSTTAGSPTNNKKKQTFTYTTEQAVSKGLDDYVQCLPNNIDIRFNLWNLLGTQAPMEITDVDDIIEVIIDNFTYTPSGIVGIENGKICTKDCQCLPTSICTKNKCTVEK